MPFDILSVKISVFAGSGFAFTVVVWFRRIHLQKQPPEMFSKKVFLKIRQNLQKTLVFESFFLLFFFPLCAMGKYGWDGSIS